ncbi:GntR family transcriptional regulator [Butyricicoccus faecihominis]|uniref:GntR family transcriptional regulator n=1 Tax=Butyricicoccaceae TaxID=3085642 RepID=UPI00247B2CD4|nr:GntR family transcriptional regulator [Agathobaculum sp. NTUH-O15-33]MCQ5128119.1 GntR family transcriptional regulator [Butyricicoccus faecihominis]WNX86422.1 GntR family transcriptional regulator [Agathobaculum sp. NTUH-O15-33]
MIQIDYRDARPLYEQVADEIEQLVLRGVLAPDSQLPSVRQLATELSINPNTIQRAYSELEQRGVVYAAKGRGNFVSGDFSALRERRLSEIEREVRSLVAVARDLGADDARLNSWIQTKGENKR